MPGYFTQQICKEPARSSIFTRSHYLSLSCLGFHLLQVILHATHSAPHTGKCNAFLRLPLDHPVLSSIVIHSFSKHRILGKAGGFSTCWEICAGKQWERGLIGLTGEAGKSRNAHVADMRRIFTDCSKPQFKWRERHLKLKQSDIPTLFIAAAITMRWCLAVEQKSVYQCLYYTTVILLFRRTLCHFRL